MFRLAGEGQGRPDDGKIGSVLKSTTGPLHIPMHLLDIVSLFGFPTYSNYHEDTKDLFKISDGYEYERSITYENGGHMKTLHKVTKHSDHLSGDFQVLECTAKHRSLSASSPLWKHSFQLAPERLTAMQC